MNTLIKAAVAATVATGLFAAPAMAAPNTDNADFTARANIVKAVTLKKNSNLNFGTITMLSTLTSQTVKVGQAAADNDCGGFDLTCSFPTQAAATFTVTGVPDQELDVVVSGDTVLTDPVTSTTVPFNPDAPLTVTVTDLGKVDFAIGGDITVVSATKDGVYTGDLNVTVTYK